MNSGEEHVFTDDASDEALEAAGAPEGGAAAFTLGNCTGLTVCPAV
jgi:hypothetical protein